MSHFEAKMRQIRFLAFVCLCQRRSQGGHWCMSPPPVVGVKRPIDLDLLLLAMTL